MKMRMVARPAQGSVFAFVDVNNVTDLQPTPQHMPRRRLPNQADSAFLFNNRTKQAVEQEKVTLGYTCISKMALRSARLTKDWLPLWVAGHAALNKIRVEVSTVRGWDPTAGQF